MTDETRLSLAYKELGMHMRVARELCEPRRIIRPMVRGIQSRLIVLVHLKGGADPDDLTLLRWTDDWSAEAMPHHSAEDHPRT
jgi:hypothetical protein